MAATARGAGQRGSITQYKKALESRKGKKANLKPLAKAAKGVAAAAVTVAGPGKVVKAAKAAKAVAGATKGKKVMTPAQYKNWYENSWRRMTKGTKD